MTPFYWKHNFFIPSRLLAMGYSAPRLEISTSVIAAFQLLYFRPFWDIVGRLAWREQMIGVQYNGEITNIQRKQRHPAVYFFWVAYIAGLKIRKAGLVTIEATNRSTVSSFNHSKTKLINPFCSLRLLYFVKCVPSLTPNYFSSMINTPRFLSSFINNNLHGLTKPSLLERSSRNRRNFKQ